jgi:hypothetical protein
VHDEPLRQRRAHDAAGRDARRRDAERLSAAAHEPAGHGGVVRQRADAGGAQGDGAGEHEVERRQRLHARQEEEAGRERARPHDLDRSRAAPVDDAADGEAVERGRELRAGVPQGHGTAAAEVLGERRQEHAPRVEHQADVHRVADERRQDDPPAVEEARISPCFTPSSDRR